MKNLRLRLAEAALSDILEQADWYEQHSGQTLAKRWENAVVASIERVAENAQLGAPCSFDEDELHGIRRISSTGFAKHSAFYQVGKRELIILRVAHGARDLVSLF